MADATVSAVVELLLSTVRDQIQSEIQLVRGFDKELKDLSEELNTIRNVLDDADRKQFKDKAVKDWLWRLEQISHQMEDVLEEWNYAILKHKIESESPNNQTVCSFIPSSCFSFKKLAFRHGIANKVRDLKSELDKILKEKDTYNFDISQPKSDHSPASSWRVQSTSLVDLAQVQGRNDIRDDLVIKLTGSHEGSGYRILSIVGGGGLGKTTIAQLVYNHPSVKACFDFTIWICVSDPFNVADIAKGIIKGIDKDSSHEATQLDALLNDLKGRISGKKILLVLDDVWNKEGDKWEPLENALKCAGESSKILVTTRNERVAKIMGTTNEDIIHPGLLSDEDCWLLLSRSAALSEKREPKIFEETGRGIAEKCKGLPLAAKTLGSLLHFRNTPEEWEEVLKSEMWELEQVEVELFPHLLLSYNELSPTLKRCFSYCAFFPKDTELEVDKLIGMWMALGYLGSDMGSVREDMELKGRRYFQDLAMRSLLQDFKEDGDNGQIMSCKMHDIVHDFAQFVRKSLEMSMSTCQVCNTNLSSQVKEYRGLSWDEGTPLKICDCLTSLRVLKVGSELNSSSQGMKKLIHLRWLDISFRSVSKEELKIICKLYFLQTLFLRKCGLKEIPMEIGNLVKLRHLDLSRNEGLKELPESMCSLLELQTLLLKECSLKEIPRELGNLIKLKHLDLTGNKELQELPESLCSLLELQTLLLVSCSLKEIPRELGNLIKLKHLDLTWNKELQELPESLCSLLELQTLSLEGCSLKEIPRELGNLVKLKCLNLNCNGELQELPESMRSLLELQTLFLSNCGLKEIPMEIGNLVKLRHLDLSRNKGLKELPKSLCSLLELQTLLLKGCSLKEIPREIGNLVKLRHLDLSWNRVQELPESLCSLLELEILAIERCYHLNRLPEGIAQLIEAGRLHRLSDFKGGSGRNKLGLLKNFNRLTGSLWLEISNCSTISDLEELVEDAQQAQLKNKICLQLLHLRFLNNNILRDEKEERSSSSTLWVDVIEALEPNHNLQRLEISFYEGSKLPLWISSPHNRLREICLWSCSELSSLPPLGKLPFLKRLELYRLDELKLVGREWLGIRGREGEVMKNDDIPSSSATNVVAFPELELLRFEHCKKWEEWEDITAGEEESAVVSIMPCLLSLHIHHCEELKLLPHRLLRKAQSLESLTVYGCTKLIECYGDDDLVLPLGDEYT